MSLFFIDTNIFMYAIGKSHAFKEPCMSLLNRVESGEVAAVTNTEVLQEILYRYEAIHLPKVGYALFDQITDTFPVIWSVEKEDLLLARQWVEKNHVKTRDAIHAATMKRYQVSELYSFDSDFDRFSFVKRLVP